MDSPGQAPAVERRRGGERPIPSHRQWTPLGRALSVAGDNWTLAIVAELARGRVRLAVLRERLAGVSAGVLDRYLQRMAESGLVTRRRFRELPPRVELELTDAGRELLPIIAALSRWGIRWAWSEPADGEIQDLAALLRGLPALLPSQIEAPDGAVELILDERGGRKREIAEIADGHVGMWPSASEDMPPEITASISGDWRSWAAALGPSGDIGGLTLSGRDGQAKGLLAALVRPEQESPPVRRAGRG